MHGKLKYCIRLLPWKMLVLTAKIIVGAIAATLITTLISGSLVKFYATQLAIMATAPQYSRFVPRHDCKSWKTTSQHKTTLITKTACVRNYFLLILVSSAPAHLDRRNLIRRTWGADNNIAPQWKTYFPLGQTRKQTLSDSLKTENNNYGDIIRADYYEHYWNQSLKIQMGFEWAARYCNFSFLLKADDDVLVNTKDLISLLQRRSTPKEGLFMGKRHRNPRVSRDGNWSVSYEEYNHTHYPDFCSGAGFVMSYDVVQCLVPLFDEIKPYRMDDVYVGMLTNRSGLTPVGHRGFLMPFSDSYDDCNFLPNILVQHRAVGQCLMKLFRMHSKEYIYGTKLGSYF
ncbi:hypothetical protein OS493_000037 [Desmophyllum pertusum]|uniref:Hexosyltransferase n=1 Tax=Desmophyllum pertusum TaxID=174260 RepID=A0A9X0A763_9CNID|nr:hypothetical protein OS493_000037 [Desmophyllum pertusum]